MTNKYTTRTEGFTLVELSIVIIIIGFLIAGIAAGTSLVKQAALNSVVTDMNGFQAAYNTFVIRYRAVPGDMVNGSTYFPDCAITGSRCNGNGDGILVLDSTPNTDETNAAWRQLFLASMISSGITIIPDNWDAFEVVGSTVPASKIYENQSGYPYPAVRRAGQQKPV